MKVKFVLLAILTLFFFIACGDKKDDPQDQPDPNNPRPNIEQTDKGNENEFVAKDGGFAVEFPSEPERMTQSVPTEVGDIQMTIYQAMSSDGNVVYFVSYNDYPAELVEQGDPESMLEEGMNGALGTYSSQLISSKKIKYGDHPGIEFFAGGESQGYAINVKARMYLVENRLYQALVLGLEGSIDEDEMDEFLETFRLL
ncbi:MAG: hypothetical protein JXA68_12255 [Ignavibacteriales bacterium]|nr:hypothetical protein [Ignavibacteriales bacterium]